MVGARVYDWMYRIWVPWDSIGVRPSLRRLIDSGEITPEDFPRTLDLGCGTGANVAYLAEAGFEAHGVDVSEVAIAQARRRAAQAGVEAGLVVDDLTPSSIPGIEGPFDFVIDYGTLDDLGSEGRAAMAGTVTRLSRPGSKVWMFCFYGRGEDLPWISFSGTSKLSHVEPGELDELFAGEWEVDLRHHDTGQRTAFFMLTRR